MSRSRDDWVSGVHRPCRFIRQSQHLTCAGWDAADRRDRVSFSPPLHVSPRPQQHSEDLKSRHDWVSGRTTDSLPNFHMSWTCFSHELHAAVSLLHTQLHVPELHVHSFVVQITTTSDPNATKRTNQTDERRQLASTAPFCGPTSKVPNACVRAFKRHEVISTTRKPGTPGTVPESKATLAIRW